MWGLLGTVAHVETRSLFLQARSWPVVTGVQSWIVCWGAGRPGGQLWEGGTLLEVRGQ